MATSEQLKILCVKLDISVSELARRCGSASMKVHLYFPLAKKLRTNTSQTKPNNKCKSRSPYHGAAALVMYGG